VINVESCHAYGSVKKFLSEVKRVLKPGGYFLMVDFRYAQDMEELDQLLKESGLTMKQEENITERVVLAIEAEDEAKQKRIRDLVPPKWQNLFAEFAGVVGSKFYRNLKDGTRFYYRYVMQK
jgi:ubiquinone/menaquinone biosynthesis C-methylase UbiE